MNIPRSTYRIQFSPVFRFADADQVIEYLAGLGISHIYASPIFKSKKGSLHGYDIVDPNQLNDEIGDRADFDALTGKVAEKGMGWIQDIVPNHMAFDSSNNYLMELIENGPEFYPHLFDIEWNHHYESIRGRLLAPILGDIYGECLERGEIKLSYDAEGFSLRYYEHRFPLRVETYASVLSHGLEELKTRLGASHSDFIKLLGVLYAIKNLPSAPMLEARNAQVSFTKAILWELYTTDQVIKQFVDSSVKEFNGIPGKPVSFSLLDSLHSEQSFKLSFWKVANEELNYRRFFTVNDLISVRVEDEQVFRDTHELVFELVNQGKITGLRVDHIDGLYDPHIYLERLRRGAPETYIVVEKILGKQETLPNVWPVQGTTGYDFCDYVTQVFCFSRNRRIFDQLYRNFIKNRIEFDQLLINKKRLIISKHMAGDIDNLALLIKKVSGKDRKGTDITLYGLRKALVWLLSFFPVYRSYINGKVFSKEDKLHLQKAIFDAKETDPGLSREFAFIERFLLLQYDPYASEQEKQEWTNVVMRFQQFTGPLMAKGFEDTVLYIYNRLISLNEVGGWPQVFGIGAETFHQFNSRRNRNWPSTLNTTSTHDTKRGEDLRARINVLSEIPQEWELSIKKWSKINRQHKIISGDKLIPDPNDEYLFYQTIIGAFPFAQSEFSLFVERIREYMLKAVREAKVHTGWIKHDIEYEDGVVSFVNKVLDKNLSMEFLHSFIPFQRKVAFFGLYNSLSQCILKITSPGVPDFYQGTELWDLSLVDPDNRRPVDYKRRIEILSELKLITFGQYKVAIGKLMEEWNDGRIKMYLIYRCIKARNEFADLFQNGAYLPVKVSGTFKENVIAFARKFGEEMAVVVVPRFLVSVIAEQKHALTCDVWKDTVLELPDSSPSYWRNVITGQEHESTGNHLLVGDVFETFPGALIIKQS